MSAYLSARCHILFNSKWVFVLTVTLPVTINPSSAQAERDVRLTVINRKLSDPGHEIRPGRDADKDPNQYAGKDRSYLELLSFQGTGQAGPRKQPSNDLYEVTYDIRDFEMELHSRIYLSDGIQYRDLHLVIARDSNRMSAILFDGPKKERIIEIIQPNDLANAINWLGILKPRQESSLARSIVRPGKIILRRVWTRNRQSRFSEDRDLAHFSIGRIVNYSPSSPSNLVEGGLVRLSSHFGNDREHRILVHNDPSLGQCAMSFSRIR